MTGAITLSADGTGSQVVRASQLTSALSSYLPVAGGLMSGAITLPNSDVSGNNAIRYTQVANMISAIPAPTGFLPLTGGTLTGALVLPNSNASGNEAVRFTQLATYAPLASPSLTGTPLTVTPGTRVTTTQIVNGAFCNTYYLALSGGTLTAALTLPTADASGNQAVRFAQVQSMIAAAIPTPADDLQLSFFFSGKPAANTPVVINMATAVTIPANYANSRYANLVNPTAARTFAVQSRVGTGTWTARGNISISTAGAATWPTQTTFNLAAGDQLRINAPSTADANMADISITIRVNRT